MVFSTIFEKKDMAYWLVKSEPNAYSFDQLIKDKKTCWSGVRNYAARNNLQAMAMINLFTSTPSCAADQCQTKNSPVKTGSQQ